jgi:hypothetical protein
MIPRSLAVLPLLFATLRAADTATVRVEVWAGPDTPLRDAQIELVEQGTNRKIDANFLDFEANHVPHGHYLLRVSRPGFRNHEQRLAILQNLVSLRVGMTVSNVPPCALTGVVSPVKPDMWLKVVPILNQDSVLDARIPEHGMFAISGLTSGEYAILVIHGRKVVSNRQFNACTNKRITISWTPRS